MIGLLNANALNIPLADSSVQMVARQLGRSAIGLDLSFTYLKENATKRLKLDKLKAWCAL